ncbi:MAG: hypothetical protein U0414_07460 [Polyangiaceae bacterium]
MGPLRRLGALFSLCVAGVMVLSCGDEVAVEHAASRHRLSCPRANHLPFTLESDGFQDPAHELLDGPRADIAEDTLGDATGVVSSTDEGLDSPPRARNVYYVGRKARKGSPDANAPTPIGNELVSLWFFDDRESRWARAGRGPTDAGGWYRFLDTAAERAMPEPVYAVLEGDGSCAAHFDALYPAGTSVVVTDIDRVLAREDGSEATGASRAMNAWAKKGYPVVYLTWRHDDARAVTREWLDAHVMPGGALITGPADPRLKTVWLDRMANAFGWTFEAAYAGSAEDANTYWHAGAGAARIFRIGEASGDTSVAIEDFDTHVEDFIDAQPEAR